MLRKMPNAGYYVHLSDNVHLAEIYYISGEYFGNSYMKVPPYGTGNFIGVPFTMVPSEYEFEKLGFIRIGSLEECKELWNSFYGEEK